MFYYVITRPTITKRFVCHACCSIGVHVGFVWTIGTQESGSVPGVPPAPLGAGKPGLHRSPNVDYSLSDWLTRWLWGKCEGFVKILNASVWFFALMIVSFLIFLPFGMTGQPECAPASDLCFSSTSGALPTPTATPLSPSIED